MTKALPHATNEVAILRIIIIFVSLSLRLTVIPTPNLFDSQPSSQREL